MRSSFTTCTSLHRSSCVDRTKEMCTPRLRWMPLQFVHTKMPRFTLAHRGSRIGQSAHTRFSGRFKHRFKRFTSAFCARSSAMRIGGSEQTRAKRSARSDLSSKFEKQEHKLVVFEMRAPCFIPGNSRYQQAEKACAADRIFNRQCGVNKIRVAACPLSPPTSPRSAHGPFGTCPPEARRKSRYGPSADGCPVRDVGDAT